MSVVVSSDVGGHTITLDVNGAKIKMDLQTAMEVTRFVGHAVDQIIFQDRANIMRDELYKRIKKESGL